MGYEGKKMTRAEHLEWCKERALAYLDAGDLANAVASMTSDMSKHDETKDYPGVLTMLGMIEVMNSNPDGVRRWIVGFN